MSASVAERLTLLECGTRDLVVLARGVAYRYEANSIGLTFTFDRLRWKWDELNCELTVRCALPGVQTVSGDIVSQATFNVSSDRARSERATRITREAMLSDIPVSRLVEDACIRVLEAERSASAIVSLHDIEDSDERTSLFECDGLTLDLTQISMFYGLPGSGKTLQAERVALEARRTGRRVGYIDFEWGPEAHRKRARGMYGPQFPDIRYIRVERPLVAEIDSLRRAVINDGWDYAVIDSVSFGVSGPPESAEVASAFLQACRQLRIGLLLVAHQSKGEGGDRYPFGSVLWYAGGRDIYHFRRSNSDHDPRALVTAITQRKTNGQPRPPAAIEYLFTGDEITIRQVNPAGIEDIAADLPIRQRLRYSLQAGPRPIEDLAEELGVKANSIIQTLRRDEDDARRRNKVRLFARGTDGRVALLERSA
ncbi:MAG: hypothetical protein ABI051_03340 [Vicinamibacterales bacterium]